MREKLLLALITLGCIAGCSKREEDPWPPPEPPRIAESAPALSLEPGDAAKNAVEAAVAAMDEEEAGGSNRQVMAK